MISGKPAEEWIINQINFLLWYGKTGESSYLLNEDILHTIPDYALKPKLLDVIRKVSPSQFELLKQRRDEDQRWKIDLTADIGNLGFD